MKKRKNQESLYSVMKRIEAGKLTQSEKDLIEEMNVKYDAILNKYIERESIFRLVSHVKNTILKKKNTVQILVLPENLFDYLYTIQKLGLKSTNIDIGPNGENAIITVCNVTLEKEKIINLINKL